MFHNFRLLASVLFCLLVLPTTITARPSFNRRSVTTWRDVAERSLNTNARRLAVGLPPMPPLRRAPTRAGSARRAAPSAVSEKVKIKVSSVVDHNTIGFLQLTPAQDRYIVGSASSADQFDMTVFSSGPTFQINIRDNDAPAAAPYLAGLISPGVELLASNANAAVVGRAPVQTAPGSTPQSGGSPSIPGAEYETAIWNYDRSPPTLTPLWVNHDGSSPPISAVWDPVGQTLYLTANPAGVILNHPGSQTVEFSPIG